MSVSNKLLLLNIVIISIIVIFNRMNQVECAPTNHVQKREVKYTTKYDNIDVDGILASKRLLRNYVNCLLEAGPCTADGKVLRTYLPDALQTECSKCSETQKKIAGKVLSDVLLNHRDDFDKLTSKYDPDGNFQKKYLEDNDTDYSDLEDA